GPFLPIAKEAPRVGDPVTAVGFGQNDPQAWFFDGSGTKRYGKNSIATFKSVFIGLIGVAEGGTGWLFSPPSGKQVTTAPGDSGGALLNARNELIGVNTLSGFSNPFLDQESGELRAVHYAINLHSEFAQNFLR